MRNVLFSSPLLSSLLLFRYFASKSSSLIARTYYLSLYLSSSFLVYQKQQFTIYYFPLKSLTLRALAHIKYYFAYPRGQPALHGGSNQAL